MSIELIISVVVIINFILTLRILISISDNDYRLVDLESENKKLEEKINILEKEIWGLEKFNYDGHYY